MFEALSATLPDRQAFMDAGKAAIGGTAASVLYELAMNKVAFFKEGSANMQMAKQAGLAVIVAVGGGMLLENQGQREMAMGAAGALGANIGRMLLEKTGVLSGCPGCVGALAGNVGYSMPALSGATFYEDDVLGTRVGTEDPEFAGLFAAAGAF